MDKYVVSESRMDGLEAQILFERFEITIPMEKGVAFDQTEAGNGAIDRLPNRAPVGPQQAVVFCGRQSQLLASGGEYLEVQELASSKSEVRVP